MLAAPASTSAAWLLRALGNRLSTGVAGAAPCLQLLGVRLALVAPIAIVSSRRLSIGAGGVRAIRAKHEGCRRDPVDWEVLSLPQAR
jgi:hypothetical protein